MDLQLSPEQTMLQATVRRWVAEHVTSQARAWDVAEAFPEHIVPSLAGMGLLGVTQKSEWGGAGLGALELALVVEELARGDGALALVVASHNGLCAAHIARAGSAAQKARYLRPLAAGEGLGAWGLTEPGSGSDAVAMSTFARREGDAWHIDGSKVFITQGSVATTHVVLAVTDREAKHRGVTAFILERDDPGFSQRPIRDKLGMRASDTAELHFDGVVVDDSRRLGEVGRGFYDTLGILDGGRITIAALAVGLGQAALDASRRYSQQRRQFGRPIGDFQAVQWKLANMATELTAARLLTQRAACMADRGEPFGQAAAMAKLFASEAAVRACEQSVQIHGGYGYTSEFPVGRLWRDSKLTTIGEGTSEIQRTVIARHVLRALA